MAHMNLSLSLESDPGQKCPLLRLPRELRDLFYDNLLVYGTIPIECAVTTVPNFCPHAGEGNHRQSLLERYPLTRSCAARQTWSIPLNDTIHVDYVNANESRCVAVEAKTLRVGMTYQLASFTNQGAAREGRPSLNLQLMRACRQFYVEARETFYSKNTFSFTSDFPMPTALWFLHNRPAASLLYISSLELALTETGWRTAPSGQQASLRCAYEHYPQLCNLMASSDMRLRHLRLNIESLCVLDDRRAYANTIAGYLSGEDAMPVDVPAWLSPLLELKELDTVSIRWISSELMLRRKCRCFRFIRDEMLQKKPPAKSKAAAGSEDGITNIRVCLANPKDIWGDCTSDLDGAAMTLDGKPDAFMWRDCKLRSDGTRVVELLGGVDDVFGTWASNAQYLRTLFVRDGEELPYVCCWEGKRT